MRDKNETLYRITVEDIFLAAESCDRDESELTPEVVEKVCHKIEAIDSSDMTAAIDQFTSDAIEELKGKQPVPVQEKVRKPAKTQTLILTYFSMVTRRPMAFLGALDKVCKNFAVDMQWSYNWKGE